ncbi:MAG TPA: UDP-N-acetylmuramoyl-tripeptide--D-alanyl-D-alanine ligase [Gammaproteobacteria bacterium]|nr:UDP-N-acetylmuramoyl-tripeptide--D-alanyl-D-alanine ligase [Gammaproteobacteria bacterium]
MIRGSLHEAARTVRGTLRGADAEFHGVSTDTRSIAPGQLFVALRGQRFDAHEMLDAAAEAGAAGVVVMRDSTARTPSILVGDTRRALGDLAQEWRRRFRLPVIAVTGSNGKTTTKEMIAAILRTQGPTLATAGNLNNDIGVPLTLFRLDEDHRYAVIEMGANRPHDIAELVAIAAPTVALVTMVAPAHLEGFGDVQGVAQAKGCIYSRLPADGVAVINADEVWAAQWRATAGHARVLTFGFAPGAEITASDIVAGELGAGTRFVLHVGEQRQAVELPFDGEHNVKNALAAAAAAHAVGVSAADIARGLAQAARVAGRLVPKTSRGGMCVIDDSYNANPASLAAAIALLARQPRERWLVFGDMGELGAAAAAAHREIGELARRAGIDRLFGVGPQAKLAVEAFGAGACWYGEASAALAALTALDGAEATVLVKGSRYMQLDRIVEGLVQTGGGRASC